MPLLNIQSKPLECAEMFADRTVAMSESCPLNCDSPVWQVEVDQADSKAWSEMLDIFEDASLYQTWSYGAVRWGQKNLSHLVLKRNDEVVGMSQLRIVRAANLKCGMAYLRWGPLFCRRGAELDPETVLRMARALHQEYVEKRRLWLRVLPNAFIGSLRAEAYQSAFSKFAQGTGNADRTFALSLEPSIEELRKRLDKKWRNQLSAAERNGLTVTLGTGTPEFRVFARMYKEMWMRKSFETSVDVEEFARMQESLPEGQRMRVLICEQEGVPVAGVVASTVGDSAIYLLGATSDQGLKAKGSYLLQWTLIRWLKENNFKSYDLGGIDPDANPGVFHFKKGLSGADVVFMAPLEACDSLVSSTLIKAASAVSAGIHRVRSFNRRRSLKVRVGDSNSPTPSLSNLAL